MPSYFPFGGSTYFLGSSIGSSDTTILLSSFLEPVTGTPYTMALINSTIVFATISPKTTSSEFISFTGITQNVNGTAILTGVTRGLAKKYPFTTDITYKQPHAGQSTFIISDAPQVFEQFSTLGNAETITGIKTFATGATPLITDTPTTGLMAANKAYVDSVAIAGAPNATTAVKGIVQQATTSQVNAGTATGSTGASLFISPDGLAASSLFSRKVGTTSYDTANASGNLVIAHGLGRTPISVKFIVYLPFVSGGLISISNGKWDGTNYACVWNNDNGTPGAVDSGSFIAHIDYDTGKRQTATLTVDATNLTIVWTKVSTPVGISQITWEVQ